MNIKQLINTILNNVNVHKKFIIVPYTKKSYLICLLLKKYCIKNIYILDTWMFIYFNYTDLKKKLNVKFFNLKDKKNFYTYLQLKKLNTKYKNIIVFTSAGICFIDKAIKLKQGGILFCIIYF